MPLTPSDPILPERRTQARVRVRIPITIEVPHGSRPLGAVSHDLSWGGVLFTLVEPLSKAIRLVRIRLPWRQNQFIVVDAQILRSTPLPRGGSVIAARFVSLSLSSQSRLERLLKALQTTAAATDCSGPGELVRELEVNVDDGEELQRMLGQLTSGRHTVTVFDSYELGQSICFSLAGTENQQAVRLRARVVDIKTVQNPEFSWAHLHDLTLEFEHPHDAIETIITHLYGPLPPQAAAAVTQEIPPANSAPCAAQCVLEERFPALAAMLCAVWTDAPVFQQLLNDLLLGNRSHPGGWPADAWEELVLLQNVHSVIYGIHA